MCRIFFYFFLEMSKCDSNLYFDCENECVNSSIPQSTSFSEPPEMLPFSASAFGPSAGHLVLPSWLKCPSTLLWSSTFSFPQFPIQYCFATWIYSMKYQGFLVYVIQCIMLSFQKPKIRAFHEDLYLVLPTGGV